MPTSMRAAGVLVPDGPDLAPRLRPLARAPGDICSLRRPLLGGGHSSRRALREQRALFCDDTRARRPRSSSAAARRHAVVRASPPLAARDPGRRRRASLAAGALVHERGAARRAALELLQEVADILGAGLERALALARERRLAMILETSGDAMLAWDREGRITDANTAAAVLTGRAPAAS